MARIRTIKPDFFLHERLAQLSPFHRLLFIGLWTQADREGRLEDRPQRLKISILPYDDCDIDVMLWDLHKHEERFIIRYEVNGKRYICIPSFKKHQRPHCKEAESTIPPLSIDGSPSPEKVGADREKVSASTLGMDNRKGKENGGGEGDGASPEGDCSSPSSLSPSKENPQREDDIKFSSLTDLWNNVCKSLNPVIGMTDNRKIKEAERLKEHSLEEWEYVFKIIEGSGFCKGRNKKDWKATYDWIIENPYNALKVLEGKYLNPGESFPPTKEQMEEMRKLEEEKRKQREKEQEERQRLLEIERRKEVYKNETVRLYGLSPDQKLSYWERFDILRQKEISALPVITERDRKFRPKEWFVNQRNGGVLDWLPDRGEGIPKDLFRFVLSPKEAEELLPLNPLLEVIWKCRATYSPGQGLEVLREMSINH